MLRPEVHTRNIIQTKLVVFRNIYPCTHTQTFTCTHMHATAMKKVVVNLSE